MERNTSFPATELVSLFTSMMWPTLSTYMVRLPFFPWSSCSMYSSMPVRPTISLKE